MAPRLTQGLEILVAMGLLVCQAVRSQEVGQELGLHGAQGTGCRLGWDPHMPLIA